MNQVFSRFDKGQVGVSLTCNKGPGRGNGPKFYQRKFTYQEKFLHGKGYKVLVQAGLGIGEVTISGEVLKKSVDKALHMV